MRLVLEVYLVSSIVNILTNTELNTNVRKYCILTVLTYLPILHRPTCYITNTR